MALVHNAPASRRLFFMKINDRDGNDGILSASSDAMRHVNDRENESSIGMEEFSTISMCLWWR